MRALKTREPMLWPEILPYAVFVYNNVNHMATGFSPNELMQGRHIEIPRYLVDNKVPIYNYENYRETLRNTLYDKHALAKESMMQNKIKNKICYDRGSNPIELEVNDLVWLKKEVKNGKYDDLYEGPYRVEEIINETNVKIRRKNKSISVHRYRLKKSCAQHENEPPLFIPIIEDDQWQ